MSRNNHITDSQYRYLSLPIDTKEMKNDNYVTQKERDENLKVLQSTLKRIGITCSIYRSKYTNKDSIIFQWDENITERKLTRNSGPRRRYTTTAEGYAQPIKIAEVKRMIKETSSEQTAKSLGISKATLYRKIKSAEADGLDYIR